MTTSKPQVEQGPSWLIEFILSPPPWLTAVYIVTFVVVLGTVGYRVRNQGWEIDLEQQYQMQTILGVATTVLSATMMMVYWSPTSYAVDVLAGFILGFGCVQLCQTGPIRRRASKAIPDPNDRRNFTWILIVAIAACVPVLATFSANQSSYVISRGVVVSIGFGMIIHNEKSRGGGNPKPELHQ